MAGKHRRVRTGLPGAFYTLWTGQAVSQFGDFLAFLTVPLFVKELTESAADFGTVYAAETLPTLLFGILGGVLLDRFRLRPILILTDLLRAAGFVVLAAMASGQDPQFWMIVVVAFVVGTLAASFTAALTSFVPAVVRTAQLPAANARLVLSQQVLFVVAPAIGGLLVAGFGFPTAFVINASTFIISAATLLSLKNPEVRALAERSNYFAEMSDGLRFVWRQPRLRLGTITGATMNLGVAFLEATLVLVGSQVLGVESAEGLGLMFGIFAIGTVAGAVAAGPSVRRFGAGRTIVTSAFIFGAGFALVGFSRGTTWVYIGLVVLGLAPPLANVAFATLRQLESPPELLGRVMAGTRAFIWGTLPIGALAGGWLADRTELRRVAQLIPFLMLVVGTWLLFTPMWRHESSDRGVPEMEEEEEEEEVRSLEPSLLESAELAGEI